MYYFLDTNVIIGATFSLDPWHENSITIFEEETEFYYSEHVLEEFNRKFKQKVKSYTKFFRGLKRYINKHPSKKIVESYILHTFVKNFKETKSFTKKNMHDAINVFLEDFDLEYSHSVFEIDSALDTFLNEFGSNVRTDKNNILNSLEKVDNHKESYPLIEEATTKMPDNINFHKDDLEILLDAHEYAHDNQNFIFVLVTGDHDFFEAIKILLGLLCISNCCYITDFVNKT